MFKRAKEKIAMRNAMLKLTGRVDGALAGLLLTYFFWGSFLLRCGDVESNPGPNPPQTRESMKQTRLTSASSSGRRASVEQSTTTSQHEKDATIADVMSMIQSFKTSMDTRFDDMKQDMQNLREDYVAMQGELKGLREDVCDLRDQNHDLQRENSYLTDRVQELERKTDDLEGRSKRSNLLFYGVPRKENETSAECERLVKDIVTDRLELSPDIDFDRVHRVNSKPDSPIIAKCTFYKHKVNILKEKRKLKGTNTFIGEDFPSRVRDIRRKLSPHLKKARGDGKRVAMVYDHLLIDGKRFTVNSNEKLVEIK